ncbi:MAG: nitroreductase family protein [Bacteroidota bacterium]
MNFLTVMQNRYTTKKYDSSKKLSPKQKEALKEILRLSPSSINSQPWKFTFVEDQEVKKQLSEFSWHNTSKVLDCDTVVVFSRIDDVLLFEQQIIEELPEGAVNYFKNFVKPLPEEQIKSWFGRQLYLALGVFLSACADMEIDATPMEGIEPDRYDSILELKDYTSLVAVAIGYRDPEDFNQPDRKPKSRRDHKKVVKSI